MRRVNPSMPGEVCRPQGMIELWYVRGLLVVRGVCIEWKIFEWPFSSQCGRSGKNTRSLYVVSWDDQSHAVHGLEGDTH
jgi:hypothetical protein